MRWPDGTLLVIKTGRAWNLAFDLAPGRVDALRGLLGPNPAEPTKTVETRDGESLDAAQLKDYETLYRRLGDSWRISDGESLFDYAAGESTASFTDLAFPAPVPWTPTDAQRAAAEAVCERLGVPPEAMTGCIFDVAETGDPGWAVTTANFLAGFRPTLAGVETLPLARPPSERLTTFPIEIGDSVSGEIDTPDARHVFELAGRAGEVVYLRALEPCERDRLKWWARHPSGSGMGGGIVNTCSDVGRVAFDVDGVYRIEVWSPQGETGAYAFTVLASEGEQIRPVTVGERVSGRIDVPGEEHFYELQGRAGQVVYLRALQPCQQNRLLWRLVTPSGVHTGGIPSTCLDIGRVEFPVDGTYRIQVWSLTDATGAYGFEVLASAPDVVQPVAAGQQVSGRIDLPGARHVYELVGRPGEVLYLRAGEPCERSLVWRLIKPDGVALGGGIPDTCLDIGRVELPVDGTYRIEIWSLRDGTGPYTFTIERE